MNDIIKILTAEDFIDEHGYPVWYTPTSEDEGETVMDYYDAKQAMIEFAQHHVTLALRVAAQNAEIYQVKFTNDYEVNKSSILTAYPITNIK